MEYTPPNSNEKSKLPIRVDKTLKWLEDSRDSWKEKTKETKDELKKQKLAVKRAREARDQLKQRESAREEAYSNNQKQLAEKERENEQLKNQLKSAHQQIDELKKKF